MRKLRRTEENRRGLDYHFEYLHSLACNVTFASKPIAQQTTTEFTFIEIIVLSQKQNNYLCKYLISISNEVESTGCFDVLALSLNYF